LYSLVILTDASYSYIYQKGDTNMKNTIIADSGCDLFDKELTGKNFDFFTVPLTIRVGDDEVIDSQDLDIDELLAKMKKNKKAPSTACPSPEDFAEKMRIGGDCFVVTLSSKVSGTYNSARLAAEMVQQENPGKKIFIVDSHSASAGEALLLYELRKLIEQGDLTFEEIVEKITAARNKTSVRFVLQDLGNLIKTGRMSKVAGFIAATLVIKPVLGDNGEGEIKSIAKCFGMKKAMTVLRDFPAQKVSEMGVDMPVIISHCKNPDAANELKKELESKYGLTNIEVRQMRGLASFYANDQGLLIAI
jgi:DegV family protein with EDD domain